MKNNRKNKRRRAEMKALAVVLTVMLMVGCGVGGTLAWLTANTTTVTNTFTVGDIDIKLDESELETTGELNTASRKTENTYKILPGTSQPKDPVVTVEKGSEACYVFVQIQEVNNTVPGSDPVKKYITYDVDTSKWTLLETNEKDNVFAYYLKAGQDAIPSTGEDAKHYILKCNHNPVHTNGCVSYSGELSQEDIDHLMKTDDNGVDTVDTDKTPKLIFKAFAVQKEVGSVDEAWAKIGADEKLPVAQNTNP